MPIESVSTRKIEGGEIDIYIFLVRISVLNESCYPGRADNCQNRGNEHNDLTGKPYIVNGTRAVPWSQHCFVSHDEDLVRF